MTSRRRSETASNWVLGITPSRYVPSNFKPDGKYRSIKIESTQGALELKYRKGYIAAHKKPPTGTEAAQVLASSMQIGVPASTAILMRVQVLPPDSEHNVVRVDYAFAPSDITFGETNDHRKRATLDLSRGVERQSAARLEHFQHRGSCIQGRYSG